MSCVRLQYYFWGGPRGSVFPAFRLLACTHTLHNDLGNEWVRGRGRLWTLKIIRAPVPLQIRDWVGGWRSRGRSLSPGGFAEEQTGRGIQNEQMQISSHIHIGLCHRTIVIFPKGLLSRKLLDQGFGRRLFENCPLGVEDECPGYFFLMI